ncbi:hypothetical protein GDN83_08235 [Gordonia jinghuaiqii]|uniref:Diacylglycerol O-acyltransferase n=1 Tax=Gordonia jinghuaiqii TaxID=2758710 RepID=A0A7D7QYJ9_9ACTN|nr:hypothetical protein [Gordonia jinghuaiqii]MCR5977726.1 hypothetical protein [Gordonia jinghuaiqii]QMT02389.1 hypothetical protein H1R19_04310 [Gordonia jinghuaiqii]
MNFGSLVRHAPGVAQDATVDRLTADDDLFVRMDVILGLPVVNQTLWRFPGTTDVDAIASLAEKLRHGRLSRLVARHRGPGRAYWRYTPDAGDLSVQTDPVPVGEEEAWGRAQADAPLDVVNGPAWRLAVARTADDSSVLVSLIISHVIADGGTGAVAVIEAVHGLDYAPGATPGLVDNVRDAADLLWTAGRTAFGMWRAGRAGPPASPVRVTAGTLPTTDLSAAETAPNVTVLIPLADYTAAATARGGTDNSLFAALMVGILERCGRVSAGDVVPVSLPVSSRTLDDRRANATSGATAFVEVLPGRYDDLTDVRVACKDAYGRLSANSGAVAQRAVVLQALSDSVTRRLTANVTTPLCLASNVGQVPDEFATLGTEQRAAVSIRAITATKDLTRLRDRKGGISGWFAINADHVMFSISSLDPVRLPDVAAVRTLVDDELAAWGLRGTSWGA